MFVLIRIFIDIRKEVMYIKKVFRVFLIILLLAATLIFPLFINGSAAAALIYNSEENISAGLLTSSDHDLFFKLGVFMVISSAFMILSAILCILKKSIPAVVLEIAGTIVCFSVVVKLIFLADGSGLTNSSMRPLADVYAVRHFPTAVHTVLLLLISLTDHFSHEKKSIAKGN